MRFFLKLPMMKLLCWCCSIPLIRRVFRAIGIFYFNKALFVKGILLFIIAFSELMSALFKNLLIDLYSLGLMVSLE